MILHLLEMIGVGVFAISGALAAGRKRFDLFGVVAVAVVTAIGGGTIRDVLLDRPVFWIVDPGYVVASVAGAVATLLYARRRRPPVHSLAIADAMGLGFFAIGGVQIAQQAGVGGLVAVVMGTITGVAGGVIRDVLSAEIPLVFRRGHLYASTAIAGSTLFLLLHAAGLPWPLPSLTGMVLIVGLRIASILLGWHLPVFTVHDGEDTASR